MEMKLELVPIPVIDVDRAKSFYVDNAGFVAAMTTDSATRSASSSSPRPARPARS
jgi:extradiol dioxygenase family protein